jgi:hypothetical protein
MMREQDCFTMRIIKDFQKNNHILLKKYEASLQVYYPETKIVTQKSKN